MIRKSLQEWYNNNDITYSEKERLNKIGIGDYDQHCLQNLKQALFCEWVVKNTTWIKDMITGTITKIEFFCPRINSVNFTTRYSCAFVRNSSGSWWVIIFRPSYAKCSRIGMIGNDLLAKEINFSDKDRIRKELSGDNPILAVAPTSNRVSFSEIVNYPYVDVRKLPDEAKSDPDSYILPLDIVKRPIGTSGYYHFAVYLGDRQVVHITGKEEGAKFDSWYNFCNPRGGSSSFSSSSGSGSGIITKYHPIVPFKQYEIVYKHIANAVASNYGKKRSYSKAEFMLGLAGQDEYDYYWNNCETFANEIVFGINISYQARGNNAQFSLNGLIESTTSKLGSLSRNSGTYQTSFNRALDYMGKAQKNRTYSRSQELTKDEYFDEYVEVQPIPPCKIQ